MGMVEAELFFENARSLLADGDKVGALHHLQIGLLRNPRHTAAWATRGLLLLELQEPFEALLSFEKAIKLAPDNAELHNSRGAALQLLREYGSAEQAYRKALELEPESASALNNLSMIEMPRDAKAAIALMRHAVALEPDNAGFRSALGMMLLRDGQLAEGWREFEHRRSLSTHVTGGRDNAFRRWQGTRGMPDQRLLICGEQGSGDTIHFVRYLPMAAAKFGGDVWLEVPPSLRRLLELAFSPKATVVCCGDDLPEIDCVVPVMSLPLICGTNTIDDIPWPGPYLHATRASTEVWRKRLPAASGMRVGLCWAGLSRSRLPAAREVDSRRSLALADLAGLATVPGINLVSLQKGDPELQAYMPPPGMTIYAAPEYIEDFADTAGLIANLDLVIAVDTSVAHLAAAMGKPTWLISRYDNCWRWFNGYGSSPWYPTIRHFRQRTWCDWTPVINTVVTALRAEADRRKAAA